MVGELNMLPGAVALFRLAVCHGAQYGALCMLGLTLIQQVEHVVDDLLFGEGKPPLVQAVEAAQAVEE
jgi:hypothetical protein